jgi:ATP-dependent DNA helicase RecG
MDLSTPISQLGRVGLLTAKRFNKLGLKTVEDLLFYFPFRYDDFSKILTIAQLKTKRSGTIKAKINLIANKRSLQKKMIITEAIVSDRTGSLKVVWFNQPFLTKILRPGTEVYLGGKMEFNEYYGLELLNPSYELATKTTPIHLGRIVPVYPTTAKLSQKQIRHLIKLSLPALSKIDDWLPRSIRTKYNLINLAAALEQIHFPANQSWLEKASHRLKFDELFLLQLKIQFIRQKINEQKAPIINFCQEETKKFVENLPFKLTNAQRKAAWEIIKDLEKSRPMNRLLEGDVGSGKTVVATIAILNVILNGYQVAYLAPTEILALQHFENISRLLNSWPLKIGILTREKFEIREEKNKQKKNEFKNKKTKKQKILKEIAEGKLNLIIGTHALLQGGVKFKSLGLIIVDEQHRFGVEQRKKLVQNQRLKITSGELKNKKTQQDSINNNPKVVIPHFLSMTATPIPRSLALTLYGDLDLSIIDEMPPGRKEVKIKIVKPEEKNEVYNFIRKEVKKGHQVFVICPLIDPSDKLGVKSVKQEYEKLKKEIFPDLELAILHGKIKAKEKEKIMQDFLKNKIQILISTTVIEVGIDVPNASIMLIEGAERFGLAQLWQLKGRVGRAKHQSYCFLVSEIYSQKSHERLKAILTAKNGFELAEKDLEMRGPGEILGTEQSGFLETLKIAKFSDLQIIKEAETAAKEIITADPELSLYPHLKAKIKKMENFVHLD